MYTEDNLKAQSVNELKAVCKSLDIKPGKMNKKELIDAILGVQRGETQERSVINSSIDGADSADLDTPNPLSSLPTLSSFDLENLSLQEHDLILHGYTLEYDGKTWDVFVNNIFHIHNAACLFRFFLSRCETAMIVFFYNPNQLLPMKSSIHIIHKVGENEFAENITINKPNRCVFKQIDSRRLTHLHHKYNTFVTDVQGRITTKSNVFCADPFTSRYLYFNTEFEWVSNPILTHPCITDVRIFVSLSHTEIGIIYKNDSIPYWKIVKKHNVKLYQNDMFSFDISTQYLKILSDV